MTMSDTRPDPARPGATPMVARVLDMLTDPVPIALAEVRQALDDLWHELDGYTITAKDGRDAHDDALGAVFAVEDALDALARQLGGVS